MLHAHHAITRASSLYQAFFKKLLPLSLVTALLLPATAHANRAIALYYDDSGSMLNPIERWYSANYSAQLLSALKSPDDELYIVKMTNTQQVEKIQSESQVGAFIQKMQQEPEPNAKTPYDGMTTLVESLAQSQAQEKWLIVVTDGMMDVSTQAKAEQVKKDKQTAEKMGVRTLFVLVEQGADRQLAEFWNDKSPSHIIETNSAKLTGVMTQLASAITGRDSQGLTLKHTGNTIAVSSIFPLRNLVVITQGQTKASVTHAHLLSQSGKRPLSLSTHNIALHPSGVGSSSKLPRFGNVAHLSFGGAVDGGDEKAEIAFDGSTKGLEVAVLPEVAGQLSVEVLDNTNTPLSKNSEGRYDVCVGDTVRLRSRLTADNTKSLISYAPNSAEFDVGFDGQTPIKSTLSPSQDYFEASVSPVSELALYPFAKYPHYFNFQSQPITFSPINCKRTIDIVSTTPLDGDQRFVRSLDQLSDDDKLAYTITLDGAPAPKATLDTWQWQYDTTNWQLSTEDGKLIFTPKTPCCALFWQRPKPTAQNFQITVATGNQYDTINYPTATPYEFVSPAGLAKLWWYLCPLVSWLGLVGFVWYLWRILIVKQRFNRRAKLYVYESATRLNTPKRLVPTAKLFSHWLLPVKHETVQIEGLTLQATGKTTALIKGAGLSEFHQIPNWSYDDIRPLDARILNMQVIELYDNRDKIVKLMQFSAKGEPSTLNLDDYS